MGQNASYVSDKPQRSSRRDLRTNTQETLRRPSSRSGRSASQSGSERTSGEQENEGAENIGTWNSKKYEYQNKEIGEGSFGEVFLATRKEDGKTVAIKKISEEGETYSRIGTLPKEYVIMKGLDRPNIAKVYDIEEDGKYFYLVMEYYEGGNLDEYSRNFNGGVPHNIIFHIARQLISAVKYCHENSVVHRDIKLENIFIKNKEGLPNIVLADFGFSSIAPIEHELYDHPGSPAYAAPELFKGIPYLGVKSDIWAIGVVLYVLFTEEFPFWDDNRKEMFRQVIEDEVFPDLDSHINEMVTQDCRTLIKWMLTKDPAKRPTINEIEHHPCYQPKERTKFLRRIPSSPRRRVSSESRSLPTMRSSSSVSKSAAIRL
jgi:serine/threonine protein kinase